MAPWTVLQAFAGGNNPVYVVEFDGVALRQTWTGDGDSQPIGVPDNRIGRIDRIVFDIPGAAVAEPGTAKVSRDQDVALWAVPTLWEKNRRHLRVQDGVLEWKGSIRCWLCSSGNVKVEMTIAVRDGSLRVTGFNIGVDGWMTDLLGENPAPYGVEGLERCSTNGVFDFNFTASRLLERVGVKIVYNPDTLTRKISFVRSNAAPSLLSLEIYREMQVNNKESELGGFELPLQANSFGGVLLTRQRQPSGQSLSEFLSHPWFAWRLDVGVPHLSVLTFYNDKVEAPMSASLSTIRGGQPLSFVPKLGPGSKAADPWRATYLVKDNSRKVDDPKSYRLVDPDDATPPATNEVTYEPRCVAAASWPKQQSPREPGINTIATFDGVRTASDDEKPKSLCLAFAIVPLHDDYAEDDRAIPDLPVPGHSKRPMIRFALEQRPEPPPLQRVKMGALDLQFVAANLTEPGTCVVFLEADGQVRDRELRLVLAVAGIAPGGQDDVPGSGYLSDLGLSIDDDVKYAQKFARPPALVFPPPGGPELQNPGAAFLLKTVERTTGQANHTVQLQLCRGTAATPERQTDAYIIDPQPLLIARVQVPNFEQDLALTTEIGNWTNRGDEAGWEIAAGAAGFDLLLPPQGLGEAMHKRRGADDLHPGEPAEFRFTPLAQFSLQSSYFRQRFVEIPWNLRRSLGYPGQRAPGAQLNSARFELFYGMEASFKIPGLRLAEIASRLGHHAGTQARVPVWRATENQSKVYELVRSEWARLYPQLQSRLAILEPWQEGAPQKLVLAEGVRVKLRESARLRYPIPGSVPSELEGAFVSDGLPGGWAWGFESANILKAVLADTVSTAAELHSLYFSSLGGWGHQKASFDNGRTTIYCDVAQGRLASVNIERIGRIEPFWNKAKHVIVYGRSVVASRQFYLEQEPLLGSPALRKLEEYVELIEDERPFPDAETAESADAAFVTACRFGDGKPRRIRVNSQWGSDVGDTGWAVPLWHRNAAPADVYPRPGVQLRCEGQTAGQTVLHSVSDPEKLHFYTDTTIGGSADSNQWAPVPGFSFELAGAELFTPAGDGTLDADPSTYGKGKPEDLVKEGYGRFTFHFDPPSGPANLTAGRSAARVVTMLDNVTIMRGTARPADGMPLPAWKDDPYRAISSLSDNLSNRLHPLLRAFDPNPSIADKIADFKDKIGDFKSGGTLDAALGKLTDEPTASICSAIKTRLFQQFDRHAQELRTEAERRLRTDAERLIRMLQGGLEAAIADVRNEIVDIEWARQRLLEALDVVWGVEDTEDDDPWEPPADVRRLLRELGSGAGEAMSLLRGSRELVLAAAQTAARKLDDAKVFLHSDFTVEERTQIVEDVREAVLLELQTVEFAVGALIRQWAGNQVDSIRVAVSTQSANVRKALLTARASIETDLEAAKQALEQAKAEFEVKADVDSLTTKVEARLDDWREALKEIIERDPLTGPIEEIAEGIAAAFRRVIEDASISNLKDLLDGAVKAIKIPGRLEDLLDLAIDTIRNNYLGPHAESLCRGLVGLIVPTLAQLRKFIADLIDPDALKALENLPGVTEAGLRREIGRVRDFWFGIFDELAAFAARLRSPPLKLWIDPQPTLRLLRTFGRSPNLPDLKFKLPDCGFHFFDLGSLAPIRLPSINLTKMAAGVRELEGLINPLCLSLPVTSLLDKLEMPPLGSFDFNKLLPDWGGLQLRDLFQGLKFPTTAAEGLKVTHGVEPTTRSAWLQVDADVPFGDTPATVFCLAGLSLRLVRGRFTGTHRVDTSPGSSPRQLIRGAIRGDWELTIGSFPIVTLKDCGLVFEEGKGVKFDVSPEKVRLQGALSFLADLMSSLGYSDSGFSFAITSTGARTALDLPLPDVQAGAFGMTNLNLGFWFELGFLPDGFAISTGVRVARRTAPFTLTIFILGGAGWFETAITYRPSTGSFAADVSIGIFASASLAIALGPVRGGIYAYFGITADFHAESGQHSTLSVAIVIIFRGEVALLGFITVGLCLTLEARYRSGGGLTGSGTICLSIKIGPFFKINVRAGVSYTFGGASGGGNSRKSLVTDTNLSAKKREPISGDELCKEAQRYEDMFA